MWMTLASGSRSRIFSASASMSLDFPDLRTPVMTLMSGVSATSIISDRYAMRSMSFTVSLLDCVSNNLFPKFEKNWILGNYTSLS